MQIILIFSGTFSVKYICLPALFVILRLNMAFAVVEIAIVSLQSLVNKNKFSFHWACNEGLHHHLSTCTNDLAKAPDKYRLHLS